MSQPLDMTARVLSAAAMAEIRDWGLGPRGWKILDRWALNSPLALASLAVDGMIGLYDRVSRQAEAESAVLREMPAGSGLTEEEILRAAGVETALVP